MIYNKEEARAYNLGWEDGVDTALFCCFKRPRPFRDFETAEEQIAYVEGREHGFNSVDD